MLTVRGRFLLVCGALLLVLANAALGEGTYQRTKNGKTFVWNNHPKPGDQATWSGGRDRDGYARGFGTLVWYTTESETGSAKPALYARYWGNMVQGKLNGPVNVHSEGKTNHAIFTDGVRKTRWAAGPASSRAGARWRAMAERSVDRLAVRAVEPEPPGKGPPTGQTENAQRSEPDRHAIEREPEAPGEGPLIRGQKSEIRRQGSEENAQPSANASAANTGPPEIDIDESLRLLAWPPPHLGIRSINKGSLAGATRARARLSKEQVFDLADAAARSRGYDPTGYERQELQYDPSDQAWLLVYDERSPDGTGENSKHLSVAVGDKTKRTALVSGQ